MSARAVETMAALVGLGWERLTVVLASIGSMTWLAAEGKVDPAAVVGLVTLIIGYIFGRSSPADKDSRAGGA